MKCTLSSILILLGLFGCTTPSTRRPANTDENYFYDDQHRCTRFSETVSAEQQEVINRVMASHEHRLYHFLWHATRNSWAELSADERQTVQTLSPLWGKHAPLCPLPAKELSAEQISPSGEEFLRMHHQMIAMLQSELVRNGLDCIMSWKNLPAANDSNFPVPSGFADDASKSSMTGQRMDEWAKKLHDPDFLRGKSLSYIGVLVEFTLHNQMHMRWAAVPKKGDDFSPMNSSFTATSLLQPSRYDAPKYQWLGNPYSAHVNPIFWKLHGWVDDTVVLWLKANDFDSIADRCTDGNCYEWRSRWVGPGMHQPRASQPGTNRSRAPGKGGSEEPKLEAVMKKITKRAGFGNAKFQRDESLPRSKAPRAPSGDPLADPEVFMNQYGPCSP